MKENENDPVLFTIDFRYKTGHKEYITVDHEYYDSEDGVRVVRKHSDCKYIEDELKFHYSGKVEVADKEGILKKDIPEFRREHKSVKDFIKYIAETDTLTIRKRSNRLERYLLCSSGINIFSYCISRLAFSDWNNSIIKIGYKDVNKGLKNIKYTDRIPWIFFMQSFGRWLYDLDKNLDAQTVYDTFLKDHALMHPDDGRVDVKQMIDNVEAFENVYSGFCNYERHKQDKEIEEAERQLELLKQKKYSNTVAGFNL